MSPRQTKFCNVLLMLTEIARSSVEKAQWTAHLMLWIIQNDNRPDVTRIRISKVVS